MNKRGDIVDYEIKDDEGNVTATFPALVIAVNDRQSAGRDAQGNDIPNESYGTVTARVFDGDGSYIVTYKPEEAPEPEAPADPAPPTGDAGASPDANPGNAGNNQ